MLSKLLPREGRFFNLFNQSAELIVEATKEFRILLSDLSKVENASIVIKNIEHKADEVTHQTVELLHKTFITPIDRDDIYKLISSEVFINWGLDKPEPFWI